MLPCMLSAAAIPPLRVLACLNFCSLDSASRQHRRRAKGEGHLTEDDSMDTIAAEKVLLDENALAKGHSGFSLGGFEVLQLTYNDCNWRQISVLSVHLLLHFTRNCVIPLL